MTRRMKEQEEYQKRLYDIKRKEFYRDSVIKRNNDIIEERKNKTLWRLERIDLKNSPHKSSERIKSLEKAVQRHSRADY